MNDLYSPHTGEHIDTSVPSEWMKRAGIPAPEYDSVTHGCFFMEGAWILIEAPSKENPRIEEIKAELLSLDQRRIRPLAEGDTEYLAILNVQAVALREELRSLTPDAA